ncbi:hypothetical protein BP5796_01067 [Coleophoma crateriformis]|uniref:LicD/FKTN/FKRP nucleotidyltransferase domain-containing protein n=1 Tax=Coleophoma crateriformis TaxID=565419 RepID=A0A3D8T9V3_9HELO|nr:hypothetical protein BP5796_01067 [Coleophoma crateriformis]
MKLQRLFSALSTALLVTPSLAAPSAQPDPDASTLDTRDPSIPAGAGRPFNAARPPKPVDTKYFKEPGGDDALGHYDNRYYTGNQVGYDEHRNSLRYLIRAYLTVFREHNIETWIAHGTLLGWWWNGKIMPWDPDLDVQVSASTLVWLGKNMNMTFHDYVGRSPSGEEVHRRYLLDINPYSVERVRGDGMNVIDARFIDTSNGMFIDITGLSETNPGSQPGVWSCKNYHRYRTRDLYPMRETVFEGVPATVPYSFDKILIEEYSQKALTTTSFHGHKWIAEKKEWVADEQQQATMGRRKRSAEAIAPHVPRSIQAERSGTGLQNLKTIFT